MSGITIGSRSDSSTLFYSEGKVQIAGKDTFPAILWNGQNKHQAIPVFPGVLVICSSSIPLSYPHGVKRDATDVFHAHSC